MATTPKRMAMMMEPIASQDRVAREDEESDACARQHHARHGCCILQQDGNPSDPQALLEVLAEGHVEGISRRLDRLIGDPQGPHLEDEREDEHADGDLDVVELHRLRMKQRVNPVVQGEAASKEEDADRASIRAQMKASLP